MDRYWRKIIRIVAEDSPNVRLGLGQEANGEQATNDVLVPGVLTYHEYQKRRATWDEIRQCVGLDAQFYEGREVKMFPPLWLNRAAAVARQLQLSGQRRRALAIGVDVGEGVSDTSWAVVDGFGLIELRSQGTPDTSVIPAITLALMRQYQVAPEYICLDRGGGGKEHADRLRGQGHNVRTVAFGEPMLATIKYSSIRPVKERLSQREEVYSYVNRRAAMYGELRQLLDPSNNPQGFAIPAHYQRLRYELSCMPLKYDEEGRLFMLPKSRKNPNMVSKALPTLNEVIGHSPDDSDALVVAVHAMLTKPAQALAHVS